MKHVKKIIIACTTEKMLLEAKIVKVQKIKNNEEPRIPHFTFERRSSNTLDSLSKKPLVLRFLRMFFCKTKL